MSILFYTLALALIYFSYRSFRGGIDYLKFFEKEVAKPPSDFAPFATVICPCKGDEDGLEENLKALFEQEYQQYEIVFVIDDENDTAKISIEKLRVGTHPLTRAVPPVFSKVVVADTATESSQKVENLRQAVLHANERSEVFVFVDSDARPSKGWLRSLVSPLEKKNVGVATGYRWFISPKPTFASELRNVWNASIASQLGPNTNSNFCWGGSMAMRRDVFEKLEIREKWRGTVSDDFTVMRVTKEAGLEIVFIPQALTPSVDDCTFREMWEFTTRQMKITRVYAPKLWLLSLTGSGLFCVVVFWSLGILIFERASDIEVTAAIATLFLVTVFSGAKSFLRLKAARLVLTNYGRSVRKQFLPQMSLWTLSPFLFFANCVAALFSRRIKWRGISYEMISPRQTRVDDELQ